jgi:predicted MPP superfamily phosphohydrolase
MRKRFSFKRAARKAGVTLLVLGFGGLALIGWMYCTATADPVVRRAAVSLPGLTEPLRTVLASDLHVARPDMPPARLAHIVSQINALRPDLVLLAGDFIGDGYLADPVYSAEEAIQPLKGLRTRLGAFAVFGNHDHWNDAPAVRRALAAANVRLLVNEAARAGPLTIGGLDDDFTARADIAGTAERMRGLGAPFLLLSHSPDPFAALPGDISLMLAGHTHCGQVRLPLIGAPTYQSRHGGRFACGRIVERGRTLIVSAGLGTSGVPLRLLARPDIWVIELRPVRAPARR